MLLIQNGNVYAGHGHFIPNCNVLCRDSLIEAVGPGVAVDGAEVIDATGFDVYPGFVLGQCAVGAVSFAELGSWDMDETSNPIVPQMDIRYAFNLEELKLQRFARAGITSYGLTPGSHALIAGQMSFIHSVGEHTKDVFLAEQMALKGNYTKTVKNSFKGKGAPETRMAMYHMLDEAFRAAAEYASKEKKDYDAGKEVLCRVLRREIPFVISANSALEIESVVRLGKKYNLRLVIFGAYGVETMAEEIMAQGWHVMLGDSTYDMAGLKYGTNHEKLVELYRKGLKLSISSSGDEAYPNAYEQLLWVAAQMSAAGATGEEIMDMMTIQPAQALGMDHLVGSLEVGKQADIIICRGNPALRFDNFVERTIMAGKEVFRREAK